MSVDTDDAVSEFGVVVEPLPEFGEIIDILTVRDSDGGERLVLDAFGSRRGSVGQRTRTTRTKRLRAGERRSTPGAVIQFRPLEVSGLQSVVLSDLVVEFFVTDAGVGLELVGVDIPVSTVLDGLLAHSLSNPAGDGRLAEVMGVDAAGINVSPPRDIADSPGKVLIIQRPVAVFVGTVPPFADVEQRRVGLSPWVDIQPTGKVPLAPSERCSPTRTLDVRVFVDSHTGRWPVEADIRDAKAGDGPNPKARVRHQSEEGLVAGVIGRVDERGNFVHFQEVVGVDGAFGAGPDRDILVPLVADILEEGTKGLAVVSDRSLREFPFVIQIEEEGVNVRLRHGKQLDLGTFSGESEPVEPGNDGAGVDRVATVHVSDELEDTFPVAIGDIGLTKFVELVRELFAVTLGVGDIRHITLQVPGDYETSSRSPPGTTKTSYIIPEGQKPSNVGDSDSVRGALKHDSLRNQFLDQFESHDRRMREAARTDPLQTHLTARDARTWGGTCA